MTKGTHADEYILEYMCHHTLSHRALYKRRRLRIAKQQRLRIERFSPYLCDLPLFCYITLGGVVLVSYHDEPEYPWHISGGPAFLSATDKSVNPGQKGSGVHTGISLIVQPHQYISRFMTYNIPNHVKTISNKCGAKPIVVHSYDLSLDNMLGYLTFGVLNTSLALWQDRKPSQDEDAWNCMDISHLGFLTLNAAQKRFFGYMKIIPDTCSTVFDRKWIATRSNLEYKHWCNMEDRGGAGHISLSPISPSQIHNDAIEHFGACIDTFEEMILNTSMIDENRLHYFLKNNPFILDPYGEVLSKPRWFYPEGKSPLEKKYIEPDFVIKRPNCEYVVVEIERKDKKLQTLSGQPSSQFTQAHFQTTEFRDYIKYHHELISTDFPGIDMRCEYWLIIGMNNDESETLSGRRRLLLENVRAKVFTFDELLTRAQHWYKGVTSFFSASADF